MGRQAGSGAETAFDEIREEREERVVNVDPENLISEEDDL